MKRPRSSGPTGDRYARQIALPMIGEAGQRAMGEATLLIVGCGALGAMQAEWAVRAGVGRLILLDRDLLELHNLHRQALYTEQDARDRLPKAEAAARRLRAINAETEIEAHVLDLTPDLAADFVRRADVTLDGTDNFDTRYLINDAAVREKVPWIYGAVLGVEGLAMPVYPGQGPCLRCVFDAPPPSESRATCETHGVLNTIVAWVAALQVTSAIRMLVGAKASDYRLHAMNIWDGQARSSRVRRQPACVCCGQGRFEYLEARRGQVATPLCSRNAVQISADACGPPPDMARLADRLAAVGAVTRNGYLLECEIGSHRLVIFPDGRLMVHGTTDPATARTLAARCLG